MKTFSRCPICSQRIKRQFLMCTRHWYMVPEDIRARIWSHYQRDQEESLAKATKAYCQAMTDAIEAVKRLEGGRK